MSLVEDVSNNTSTITPFYAKLKRYWRQKRYERLRDGEIREKKKMRVRRLGGDQKKKRNWLMRGIRVVPQLKVKVILVSPLMKLLSKIRDGYISMTLRLAGNVGTSSFHDSTANGFVTKRIPQAREAVVKKSHSKVIAKKSYSKKEYDLDSRLILEIYNALMASTREQLASDMGDGNIFHHQPPKIIIS